MSLSTELRELLEDMGWIHWETKVPPNHYQREILELNARTMTCAVVFGRDFNIRIEIRLKNKAKRADLWDHWWMPLPVPPARVVQRMQEASRDTRRTR